MRYLVLALALMGELLSLSAAAAVWPEERPAQFKYTCKEVQVSMRDGVTLAADLYLPSGPGPFPVIVERTPYNKNDCQFRFAIYLVERGYAVLVQDVRGRYHSEGEFYNYLNEGWGERQDGYETIEWAGTQSWSNGKVGTMGLSYTCFNQNLTAVTQPAHLKAMFCSDSASNWYKDFLYPGGVMRGNGLDWDIRQFSTNDSIQRWDRWYVNRIEKGLDIWQGWEPRRLMDSLVHTTYDNYWRQFAPEEHIEKFTLPVYFTTGWYDEFTVSGIKMFNAIRQRGGSPLARESVKLLIGPWLHGQGRAGQTSVAGDLDFGPESFVNYGALMVRWFDYHLRGVNNGIMKEQPVRIFVMGTNKVRWENEFPPARATQTKFYLNSTRSGSIDSLNDGTLSRQKQPAEDKADVYDYDPKRPVQSIGESLFVEPKGARDHRPADRKSLTFTTAPMTEDMEITGPPVLELYVSSTADDTDFVATLTDVHPNGYAQVLRQDALRASRRESLENPTPMEPGKIYKLTIPMVAISNAFLKGHRLRLTLSSSSFPRYMPNRNKFTLNNEEAPFVTARNTIYHDAQHPSVLTVPVIPSK